MGIGWTASSPLHSVVFLKKTSGEPLVFFFLLVPEKKEP